MTSSDIMADHACHSVDYNIFIIMINNMSLLMELQNLSSSIISRFYGRDNYHKILFLNILFEFIDVTTLGKVVTNILSLL